MSKSFRRYEFLLPRRYNDQTLIPDEFLVDTMIELETRIGSVSSESQVIHGTWRNEGQSYRDKLIRVFVDVPDNSENRAYFEQLKELLKTRFRQIDIWMTTYLIEVI